MTSTIIINKVVDSADSDRIKMKFDNVLEAQRIKHQTMDVIVGKLLGVENWLVRRCKLRKIKTMMVYSFPFVKEGYLIRICGRKSNELEQKRRLRALVNGHDAIENHRDFYRYIEHESFPLFLFL